MGQTLRQRVVDNPSLTDGLAYSEQRNQHLKITVTENAMTRIGALCFIRRREPHHERAAEIFKNLYEARYGSASGAMDPSRVQVDTSPIAHDSGMAAKIDRTWAIQQAEQQMPTQLFDALVSCIVLGIPAGEGEHWRVRSRNIDAVLEALESLSVLWRLAAKA